MKIQCSVCEAAEATVICCADEAALCEGCDQNVHAANKLASKHQRVSLSNSSSQMPNCDICQESVGYFFCIEDRALLCRKCDVAIHSMNLMVSAHQRFLLTGVKVGIGAVEPACLESSSHFHGEEPPSAPDRTSVVSQQGQQHQPQLAFAGGSATRALPQWSLDELLAPGDYNPNFYFMDNGSSMADSGKLGDSEGSLRAVDAELENDDDCLLHVPDYPQISSPPTASGLYWPGSFSSSSLFVPGVASSPSRNFHNRHKRRRNM